MQPAMGMLSPSAFVVACLYLASCPMATPLGHATSRFQDFRPIRANNRTFPIHFLAKVVDDTIEKSRQGDVGIQGIEAAMESSFRALPKTNNDMISHSAATYIVQKYFTQVHHYHIKGPGTPAVGNAKEIFTRMASLQEASILEAPDFVASLVEMRQARREFTLGDVAVMASALKSLIEDEVVMALDLAMEVLEQESLISMVHEDEVAMNDVERIFRAWQFALYHDSMHLLPAKMKDPTHRMVEFGRMAKDMAATRIYQQRNRLNPFQRNVVDAEDRMALALDINEGMGLWQDQECQDMKAYLTALDPDGTGRVPLNIVYEQPARLDEKGKTIFRFSETQDALRAVGALDESVLDKPQVLISNYVLGPLNCLRLQSFHTYCCLSECESLMAELEEAVQGPAAAPELILASLANITENTFDQSMVVPDVLLEKLSGIAAYHGGVLPLHGRLFAQWLHFMFPQECPYPHVTQRDVAGNSLTTSFFQQVQSPVAVDLVAENQSELMPGTHLALTQWTDDEMLPFEPELNRFEGLRSCVRIVFLGSAMVAMLCHLFSSGKLAYRNYYRYGLDKKSDWEVNIDKVA